MLPDFEVFDSNLTASFVADFINPTTPVSYADAPGAAANFGNLLPTLSNFRAQVAKVASQQRKAEQSTKYTESACNFNSADLAPDLVTWGEQRNGRQFRLQANGTARYEFRSGETLRAVVIDLLTESKKSDKTIAIDYLSIRAASQQILAANGIADADLVSAGDIILIPSQLMPKRKFAA